MVFILVILVVFFIIFAALNIREQYIEHKQITSVTSFYRGERSERSLIPQLLNMGIDPRAIFHDIYIKKPYGEYTQIDMVVATKVGLIVIEVKEYSGWIFGNGHQQYWTQVMAYGRNKYRFYNPIMQNEGHIKTIRELLPGNPGIPIYSIIVFDGNCELKNVSYNAPNTFVIYSCSFRDVVNGILMQPPANYGNKYEIMELFTKAQENGNNQEVVSAQISAARYHARNKPAPTYKTYYRPWINLRKVSRIMRYGFSPRPFRRRRFF